VVRVPNEHAAVRRARWLADLGDALEDAGQLMKKLGAPEGRIEAVELYTRIEAARLEVQAMRLRKPVERPQFDPEWTNFPWKRMA